MDNILLTVLLSVLFLLVGAGVAGARETDRTEGRAIDSKSGVDRGVSAGKGGKIEAITNEVKTGAAKVGGNNTEAAVSANISDSSAAISLRCRTLTRRPASR